MLARFLGALALVAVFLFAFATGVLVHMDLPVSRRLVAERVNVALSDLPSGRVELTGLEKLTPSRILVQGVEGELTGTARFRAEHVGVRFDLVRTVATLLRERHTVALHLRRVEIDLVDVTLVPGPKPAGRKEGPREKPLELRIDLDDLRLPHAYVHGALPGGTPVDVDLDGIRSTTSIDADRARATVVATVTARAILPEPLRLDVDAALSVPLGPSNVARSGSIGLSARAGGVELDAHGELRGSSVEVEVAIPETPPEAMRALWKASPFAAPVSLRGRVGGTLPRLDARLDAEVGSSRAHAEGWIDLEGGPTAAFEASARDVDLRAFGATNLRSTLGFDARGTLRAVVAPRGEIPLQGEVFVTSVPSSIAGEPLPRIEGRVVFDRVLRATATAEEPGASARVEVTQVAARRFRSSIEANIPSLADVSRFAKRGWSATGRAVLRADATLDDANVSSRATLDVYRAGFAKVAVGAGRIEARMEGPLRSPMVWASAHVIALRREPYAVNDLLAQASGTPDAFDLALAGRGGTFDAAALDARIERGNVTAMRNVSARIERGGESVSMAARSLAFGPDVAEVDGLSIDGLGGPITANASRTRGKVSASIEAPDFDLDRLALVLGLPPERLGGKGSMTVSLDVEKDRQAASARVRLAEGRFGALPPLDAAVDLGIDGASAHGLVSVRNPELGGAHLEVSGELAGSILDPRSLVGSSGRVVLSSDRISLARVCATLPCSDAVKRAVSSSRATMEARAVVERATGAAGGDTKFHFEFQANDSIGRVAHATIDSQLDISKLVSTRRLPVDAPVEADFGIEKRSFEDWPANLRPARLMGQVEVHGYAQGTIGQPFVVIELAGHGIEYVSGQRNVPALDLEWVTTYDLEQAATEITVRDGSRDVVRGSVQVEASLEKLLSSGDRPWNGGAYIELDRFPLAFLPSDTERLTGNVSGKISIAGLHDRPRAQAHLQADDVYVGRDSVGPVRFSFEADEHACLASIGAGAANPAPNTGRAVLRAKAGCVWKNATIPSLDPKAPMELAIDATHFALGALDPFVDAWVERLRGKLDAHLRASALPLGEAGTWVLTGEAHVREGNMLPLLIGREVKQIELDLQADQKGSVRVERIAGEIGGGRFSGVASLQTQNLAISAGHAELHVARRQAIPVTIEGVSYGTIWGDVFADAHVTDDALLVDVRAPTLRADLPPQRNAQLEDLKDDPAIAVIQPLGPPERARAVGGGPIAAGIPRRRLVMSLVLGNNVGISREDMKVELTTADPPGNPKLTFDPEAHVAGAIRILGGSAPVAGRVFRIERGIVRFGGDDPANPALDIDAVYEGADASATRINVHVGGTAKDVRLSLTSSPPKPESELFAILAFGEAAPATGIGIPGTQVPAGAAPASSAAVGVGSAILTTGVNQLLSQSVIPIRTSLTTGATTLASASVELTERVRVQYIRVFGATLYGQQQDANQFALDWRFKPRWLLRTVVGDRGTTTLDVLWNRWY